MPVQRMYVAIQVRDMTDLAVSLIASGHEQGSSTSVLGILYPLLGWIEQYVKEGADNGGKH